MGRIVELVPRLIVHARWLPDFERWGDWLRCCSCGAVVDRSEVDDHRRKHDREALSEATR